MDKAKFRLLFIWYFGAGVLAGAGFNLAFGSALWNVEGIIGGLVSAILINFLA